MNSIVTKKGDDGTTGLLMGSRVLKNHQRIKTIGALDELNAYLGVCKAYERKEAYRIIRFTGIQQILVQIMGELAVADSEYEHWSKSKISVNKLTETDLTNVEDYIKAIESEQPSFAGWATPGSNTLSAHYDYATRVCRRAERELVQMHQEGHTSRLLILQFINRLSDYLWITARSLENVS